MINEHSMDIKRVGYFGRGELHGGLCDQVWTPSIAWYESRVVCKYVVCKYVGVSMLCVGIVIRKVTTMASHTFLNDFGNPPLYCLYSIRLFVYSSSGGARRPPSRSGPPVFYWPARRPGSRSQTTRWCEATRWDAPTGACRWRSPS